MKHLNVHQYGSLENISDDVTDVFCSLSDLLSELGRSRASVCVYVFRYTEGMCDIVVDLLFSFPLN